MSYQTLKEEEDAGETPSVTVNVSASEAKTEGGGEVRDSSSTRYVRW